MNAMRTLAAELHKAVTLPATWIAAGVGVGGTAALAVVNGWTVRSAYAGGRPEMVADASPFETALMPAILTMSVTAVVLGVTTMSSEYAANSTDAGGGRQISTTLAATPSRALLLAMKAVVVATLTAMLGVVAVVASVAIARAAIGGHAVETVTTGAAASRLAGGTLYWVLLALIALAVATLARTGLVPLVLLIVNCAVVPLSMLLLQVTKLANWLPDLAGRELFGLPPEYVVPGGLDAATGGLVMASWAFGLLLIAGLAFVRRDA